MSGARVVLDETGMREVKRGHGLRSESRRERFGHLTRWSIACHLSCHPKGAGCALRFRHVIALQNPALDGLCGRAKNLPPLAGAALICGNPQR
jgi:hypothetical protein